MFRIRRGSIASLAGLGVLAAAWGCGEREAPPTSPQTPTPKHAPPATPPATAPTPKLSPVAPADPPEPVDPFHLTFRLSGPDQAQTGWVRVGQFFNDDQPAGVDAKWEGDNRIIIDTRNVQRMSLDLGRLPVRRGKSLFLRLNGQGIQLSSRHGPVVEFERGQAGNWSLRRE